MENENINKQIKKQEKRPDGRETVIRALRSLNSSIDFKRAFDELARTLAEGLGMEKIALLHLKEEPGSRKVQFALGPEALNFTEKDMAAVRESISSRIINFLSSGNQEEFTMHHVNDGVENLVYILPLRAGERFAGVFVMSKPADSGNSYDIDMDILYDISREVAIFVERQRLYRKIESDKKTIEFLYTISREINSTFDVRAILTFAARKFLEAFPFAAVAILVAAEDESFFFMLGREKCPQELVYSTLEDMLANFNSQRPEGEKLEKKEIKVIVLSLSEKELECEDFSFDLAWNSSMIFNNKMIGIFGVFDFLKGPVLFSAEVATLINTLANQVTVAIENARMFRRTEKLAFTDGVTGLFNHRYFQESLEKEVRRALRYGTGLSLIMSDIDHFKKFNDTYGHQQGDEVLKEVARLFKKSTRDIDVVARYGGEEIVAILPETDLKGTTVLAERIRNEIASHHLVTDRGILNITASFGVATLMGLEEPTGRNLIEAADQALYAAKARGRNITCVHLPRGPILDAREFLSESER